MCYTFSVNVLLCRMEKVVVREKGNIMLPRLRLKRPSTKDVFNSFCGKKSRVVAKHVEDNLSRYQNTPPENIKPQVMLALREKGLQDMGHSVGQTLFRLRQKGVLPKLSREDLIRLRKYAGRKGMEVKYNRTDFKSDVIKQHIRELLEQGVDSSEISAYDVLKKLQKDGIDDISARHVGYVLYPMRKTGELKQLSNEIRKSINRDVVLRGHATKEKNALSNPFASRAKSIRLRAFIKAMLDLGVKPSEISARKVFDELKDKIPGLRIDDVWFVLNYLRKSEVLPPLTKEEKYKNWLESLKSGVTERGRKIVERQLQSPKPIEARVTDKKPIKSIPAVRKRGQQKKINSEAKELADTLRGLTEDLRKQKALKRERVLSVDRTEQIRKLMEAREMMKKIDSAIAMFQKYSPELKGVGDSDVFYGILYYLMKGTDPHIAAELIREDRFRVSVIDVACVANHFANLLHTLNSKELSALVSQTNFWSASPIWRDLLAKYVLKFETPLFVLMSRRLKELGQRL